MKVLLRFFALLLPLLIINACNNNAPTNNAASTNDTSTTVKYQLVTEAVNFPVEMVAAPDSSHRLFISDLSGKIYIMQNGKVLPQPFIDISSKLEQKDSTAQMKAVFSIAFHPQFATNKKFYICYNAPADNDSDKCKLQVSEFTANTTDANTASLATEHKIFAVNGGSVGVDDCEIAFGPDGYLYISIGDNGTALPQRQAQNLNSYYGKLLRIDVNKTPYAIPADNPFVKTKNAKPEIWCYGLRRLWRFSFDEQTNLFLGADVGDKLQEEVDVLQKGGNYGWPVKEGDSLAVANVDTTNFIAPINTYTHQLGICVIGGHVYHGNALPRLQNNYVFADYNGHLFSMYKSNNQWQRQTLHVSNAPDDAFLIVSVDKDENNELYLLGTRNTKTGFKGAIYKLVHG